MALGIGRMLGFRLPENFNSPYAADSFQEFWRRWNMSLTNWCNTYLGLSLKETLKDNNVDSERQGPWFCCSSLFASGTGQVGACSSGVRSMRCSSCLNAHAGGVTLSRWPTAPLRHVYLLVLANGAWVFFRADTLPDAFRFFQALGGFGATGTQHGVTAAICKHVGRADCRATLSGPHSSDHRTVERHGRRTRYRITNDYYNGRNVCVGTSAPPKT